MAIKLRDGTVFIKNGKEVVVHGENAQSGTMAYKILSAHNVGGDMQHLKLKFDALASHDITYVSVIQTARASGMQQFPVPYVLTNCHNSLCAVGGTINADDHQFGLFAAKKYGGDFVPAHMAVIHQYMREVMAGGGKMILATDSHTRYGPLGTIAIGEGGGEIVKQLLGRTYDIEYPQIIAVKLDGKPNRGVGPMDVALTLIKETFANGFVKNKILEFVGEGVENLSIDFRNGIDVMTTETTCLSSIWKTDGRVAKYLKTHGRESDFREINPDTIAQYDGLIEIDLSKVKPMMAMPFHPSFAFSIEEFNNNPKKVLAAVEAEGRKTLGNNSFSMQDNLRGNKFHINQAIVAGCAGGTYENITEFCDIIGDTVIECPDFTFSVYPSSQPVMAHLTEKAFTNKLIKSGAIIKTAFCGPCFGAGEVPSNGGVSIRHVTRNFPNREGSKPKDGQIASVIIMDARSIAATVKNGGILTPATDVDYTVTESDYKFDNSIYAARIYRGAGKPQKDAQLKFGPGIKDWPPIEGLGDGLIMKVCCVIRDEVTTTDELIPSGETSSYRSNPMKLAEFTLSRKDPEYVARAKAVSKTDFPEFTENISNITVGSVVVSNKPGDGSAREQAASCQRVLGGVANIAVSYATKRYRSNLINWGMIPFTIDAKDILDINIDYFIQVPGIRQAIKGKDKEIGAMLFDGDKRHIKNIKLYIGDMTDAEREILVSGCLINYYKNEGVRK
jgi:aconitate hydratase